LFADLGDAELGQVARFGQLRSARAGDVLTREGASGYSFFVILAGTVDVDRGDRRLETLHAGDFFGEMAIVGGGRRNATVTAASTVELFVVFGTAFRSLEQQHPESAELIKRTVAERLERVSR